MIQSLTVNFPDHAPITFQYPESPLMNAIAKEIFSGNEYPVVSFLRTDDTAILDLGANVGFAAVLFSIVHPRATVYALEPAREPFEFLTKNAAPFKNIKPFNIGAYSDDRQADFFPGEQASVTGSLFPGAEARTVPAEKVTLRRFSSFITEQNIRDISILKIDTEGAELAILGDIPHLLPAIQAIYIEFHSEPDRLEIDKLLIPHFSLCNGTIKTRHRGRLLYLSRALMSEQPTVDAQQIHH